MHQLDESIYQLLHKALIARPTRPEKQRDTEQQQHQKSNNYAKKKIIVHFIFESGSMLDFRRQLRQLWENHYIYENSLLNNVLLIIATRSNKSLNQLPVKKKLPREILANAVSTYIKATTNTTMTSE